MHHTDCGMLTFDNPTLYGICREQLGADASDIDFLPFSDLEQSVRDDVELIRSSPLIAQRHPGDRVRLRREDGQDPRGRLRQDAERNRLRPAAFVYTIDFPMNQISVIRLDS